MLRAKTLIISMSKRKAKRPMQAQEHGSDYAKLRRPIVIDETMIAGVTRARVAHETRLDWYNYRALIDDRQRAAGKRFNEDWIQANAEPRVVSSYARTATGIADYTEECLRARRRVLHALNDLGQGIQAGTYRLIVISVCGKDEWAHRGTQTLREALNLLAHHYRLPIGS